MAAFVPPGGAGTGSPLTGLEVPLWRENVPSLPNWSALVHEVNPDSNPPFKIEGPACAGGTAAKRIPAAANVETVKLVDAFIERSFSKDTERLRLCPALTGRALVCSEPSPRTWHPGRAWVA